MKAIISGASKGIGKACAIQLANVGYDLCLISRKLVDLNTLKSEILKENKVRIELLALDLTDQESVENTNWKEIIGDEDQILLINNLGTYANDKASELSTEEIEQLMRINLYAGVQLSGKVIPAMKASKQGQIVNIASINGLAADQQATAYSISKHALKAWNDALREELRNSGIKVTAFYPGPVNTSSWDGLSVDHQTMIQPEDIAELVLSLGRMSASALVEEIRISPVNFDLN